MTPLLELRGLARHFAVRGGTLRALDGVDLALNPGETLGIVGESGCGKTTLAKTVIGLQAPTAGEVLLEGQPIAALKGGPLKAVRRRMQMVFQDPFGSLNPRATVGRILREPFIVHGLGTRAEQWRWAEELVEKVGLPSDSLRRHPHEFSGGQRQRIGIARALALRPALIVCDEPVSALDVSVQAQVLNLLLDLQQAEGISYLFISHDLGVVEYIADRVAVMYLGRVVELSDAHRIWERPLHPYTRRLLSAVAIGGAGQASADEVPSPLNPPSGCRYHPRCPFVQDRCRSEAPALRQLEGAQVACHFAEKIAASHADDPAPGG
ncbi:MAG: ATP-binding cassette domain-containing protein [Alphaproteobacteria bacterium]|nr:ATP-binding cassette domain-containing protein [Alphaproteobacteria bacterium]